jgi:hypothetical protein
MEQKHPVGVIPRYIWIEHRVQDLKNAIYRYREAGLPIPNEWYMELEEYLFGE